MKISCIAMLLFAAAGTLNAAAMEMNIEREEQQRESEERLLQPSGGSEAEQKLKHVEPMSNPNMDPDRMERLNDEESADEEGHPSAITEQPGVVSGNAIQPITDPMFPITQKVWETRAEFLERDYHDNLRLTLTPDGQVALRNALIKFGKAHDHKGTWSLRLSRDLPYGYRHEGTNLPTSYPDSLLGDDHAILDRGIVTSPTTKDGTVGELITSSEDNFPKKASDSFKGTLKTRNNRFDYPEQHGNMAAWLDGAKTKQLSHYMGDLNVDGIPNGQGMFRGSAADWHNAKLGKEPASSAELLHDEDWKPVEYDGQWKDGQPHGEGTMKYDDPSTPGEKVELGPKEGTWKEGKFQLRGTDVMSYLRKDIVDHPPIPSLAGFGFDSKMWREPPSAQEQGEQLELERDRHRRKEACCQSGAFACACVGATGFATAGAGIVGAVHTLPAVVGGTVGVVGTYASKIIQDRIFSANQEAAEAAVAGLQEQGGDRRRIRDAYDGFGF